MYRAYRGEGFITDPCATCNGGNTRDTVSPYITLREAEKSSSTIGHEPPPPLAIVVILF